MRLRPILMTTAAMVVGMAPLIFATGAGAVSRFNIGVTIFFGMAIGTLFTLFVTPAVYTFLARDHAALMAKEKALGHLKEKVQARLRTAGSSACGTLSVQSKPPSVL